MFLGSSGIRVGKERGLRVRTPALGAPCDEVEPRRKPGMIAGCDPPDLSGVSPTRIGLLASAPCRRLSASSVIPAGALSRWSDAHKHGLRSVRLGSPRGLRPNVASGSRPPVRRHKVIGIDEVSIRKGHTECSQRRAQRSPGRRRGGLRRRERAGRRRRRPGARPSRGRDARRARPAGARPGRRRRRARSRGTPRGRRHRTASPRPAGPAGGRPLARPRVM